MKYIIKFINWLIGDIEENGTVYRTGMVSPRNILLLLIIFLGITHSASATSNLSGATYTLTATVSHRAGYRIDATTNNTITAVVKSATSTAPYVEIWSANGATFLASSTYSGNTATFATPFQMASGTTYLVVDNSVDNGASVGYTRSYANKIAYPRARTDLTYTANCYDLGTSGTSVTTTFCTVANAFGDDSELVDIQTAVPVTGLTTVARVRAAIFSSIARLRAATTASVARYRNAN